MKAIDSNFYCTVLPTFTRTKETGKTNASSCALPPETTVEVNVINLSPDTAKQDIKKSLVLRNFEQNLKK